MTNLAHKRTEKFSFGKEKKCELSHLKEQKHKPGAGTYELMELKKGSPSFGFGSAKRPDIAGKKDATPAPGAYKLPSRMMNTASYA